MLHACQLRIRRVKCDEGKPSCNRCVSTGRRCDGYPTLIDGLASFKPSPCPSRPVESGSGFDGHILLLELEAFDYFRHAMAPRMSGYGPDSAWNKTIPLLFHAEPAVRHAVVAIAATHRGLCSRTNHWCHGREKVLLDFPTRQYTKAIGCFRKLLSSDDSSANIKAACLILFAHHEALQENFAPALLHINNISTILLGMTPLSSGLIDASLIDALKRIDIMASVYVGSRVPVLANWHADRDVPDSFENISEARRTVDDLTCSLYYFLRTAADHVKYPVLKPVSAPLLRQSEYFEAAFEKLETMIGALKSEYASDGTSNELEFVALAIRAKLNKLIAVGCLFSNETILDAYVDEFRQLLDMCTIFNSSSINQNSVSSILLDETLLHPLTQIVAMCRDGSLRQQALRELKSLAKLRKSWHVEISHRMVARLVELEKHWSERDSTSQETLGCQRIVSHGFDSSQNLLSRDIPVRYTSLGTNGEWTTHEEIISW